MRSQSPLLHKRIYRGFDCTSTRTAHTERRRARMIMAIITATVKSDDRNDDDDDGHKGK